ncbi:MULTISPECIES: S8 family serine peptidase [Bosea]|uniref:S8 family serine peptidase n=1 Tax=Bosea TaxID=85413 RepID=UPI00214FD0E3|nr:MULTISPECIES: S8 family serine peptidase [Bosea]MCR4522920.1 S8 family serine peptidase [Bosea sp. 47.2.35]MDR6828161.1 subtilisin family serine protease [Bosea robiniae]MDR6894689.1 subtilisin family serine protease [Bosea sp. BE109]MDR7138267.1 subtilisin family serine protease [Bosea sp. BE168]MDR7174966.1 subtilisin family serine protease [Bosea sp. BE271]
MLPSPFARRKTSVRCLVGASLLACALVFVPGLAFAQTAGGTGDGKRIAPTTSPQQPAAGGTNRSMRVPPGSWLQPRAQRSIVPALDENRFVPDEVLFELAPNVEAEAVLRRYGATLIARQRFDLAGVTIIRAKLEAGRDLRAVLTEMGDDANIAGAQPNFLFELQQDSLSRPGPATASSDASAPAPVQGGRVTDPATAARGNAAVRRMLPPQYVVDKLRLSEARKFAQGRNIRVGLIDSGVDMEHPEIRGSVLGYLDAIDGLATPHAHGTSMATAIVAHGELQGIAPAALLIVARAFGGPQAASANGKSFQILTALEWIVQQRAKVVNLSFAGPQDRLLSKALAGAKERGVITVAAAGNGGARSAPLYPGADPSVIAVTATDAEDKVFSDANRGAYVAIAAPGVDVLTAEPGGRYAFTSGTSIAAAHVTALVALLLEKQPELDTDSARRVLAESATDLGSRGRDPVYGAGRIDPPTALARVLPVATARP